MGDFRAAMIAGTHSGSGKTTWSLALMELARRKNLAVQPFKCGPDYIDPGFHSAVCSPVKSRNLDLFLLSESTVRETFSRHGSAADLALIEGVMGLFDGKASTAQVSKILGVPVFLVLDGAGLAESAAAVVLGFQKFDPAVNLAGVLINRVKTESHFNYLKMSIELHTGVPCLGYLPPDEKYRIPERHLGLTTAAESGDRIAGLKEAADFLEKHFDWEVFVTSCARKQRKVFAPAAAKAAACRVGVARDEAFSFYYEDNFDLIRAEGGELVFFSPLEDEKVPDGLDLIYFGGGFPEIYAAKLSANESMLQSVRDFYRDGGSIYAECGGFIYMTEAFTDKQGTRHGLCGLVPGTIKMKDRLQNFGYHESETLRDTFLFPAGRKVRSHEFHYSAWEGGDAARAPYRLGERYEGFAEDRLLASYQHLHFGSDPAMVRRLVEKAGRRKTVNA